MFTSLRSILFLPLVLIAVCGYSQAPTITSFSPATGPVGTLVTINGTNLNTPTAFIIGGQSAIVVSNTGSVLVGMVMPNAATGAVSVTTADGTASGTGNFTVTATKYPSVQQGSKLVGTGSTGTKIFQGSSVSVSADGNTAIVGGKGDNTNIGAAWVYTRSGGTWTQQGAKLLATDAVGAAQQGIAVALSADGNTAIIGGNDDNSNAGAAWIYTRSGGIWTQQGSKLVGTGTVGAAQQGIAVSMSADGNTAIVGGSADNSNAGAAWIFTRSGGVWTQQGSKLVGTGSVGAAEQGSAVSMSADGNTVIVGGLTDNSNAGAVWVYTRSGTTWTQQGSKLVGTGGIAATQGNAVSLSADGNTALVGGDADEAGPDGLEGAVWVFTRSGGAWAQQGSKLVATNDAPEPSQGSSVSLSADGNTAIIGAYTFNSPGGAVWIYSRVGTSWIQQSNAIIGTTGNVGDAEQGFSVSMSADGNTAIEGGLEDNLGVGAAWVFISGLTEDPPTVQATAVTFTNTTGTGTTVNWTNGNGASRVVFITAVSPEQPASPVPENGSSYTANAVYGEGEQFQVSEESTWYCIYNGSGSTVNVTNLSIGTTYRIVVFEYNAITGYQEYLTTTGTGNPGNFTTISSNALLKTITLTPPSGLTLTGTTGSTATYTATVNTVIASVTVTPTPVEPTTTITVNGAAVTPGTASGPIALAVGQNTINIVTTAQDGITTQTYSITVTRASPSNDASIRTLVLTPPSTLTNTGTTGTTTTYTTSVSNATASIKVTPTTTDANATVKVNGSTVASGTASAPIALAIGQNTITTIVTAQDGITTHTYSITVTRLSNNALLSSIRLTPASALTNTGTSGTTTTYTTSISNTTASVTVTPTKVDATATIKVNGVVVASGTASGPVATPVGKTTINTVVTAQDGTTHTYSIIVTRPSSNNILSSIKLTPASALTNTGTSGTTTTYTTTANSATTSVKVIATTADPTASIKVNGSGAASGSPSVPIATAVGKTTITIVVTAQDGATRTYSITVTRPSNNAVLSSIKLTPASTLTNTGTSGGTTTYTTSVPNSETSLKVTPTTDVASATVKVNGVAVVSGTASGSIALVVGQNTINTVVTAQDGTTLRYTITVTRASGPLMDLYLPVSVVQPSDKISIESDGVMVHQGVTPNGDGINDFLHIDGLAAYPDNNLMIIDRSGTIIFETAGYDNINKVFDGHSSINGRMQQPGTYFYSLDYVADGQNKHKTGYIILKY